MNNYEMNDYDDDDNIETDAFLSDNNNTNTTTNNNNNRSNNNSTCNSDSKRVSFKTIGLNHSQYHHYQYYKNMTQSKISSSSSLFYGTLMKNNKFIEININ